MLRTKLNIINDDTNEWDVSFYENEKICESREINMVNNKIVKQFSGYGLILDDVTLLIKWANELNKKVSIFEKKQNNASAGKNFGIIEDGNEGSKNELFQSFTALCIIYGRLFSGNARGTKLERTFIENKYYAIHDELLNLRNNYIAHSSDKTYEESKVFIILNPDDSRKFLVVYHTRKIYFTASKLLDDIIEYFKYLSKIIIVKQEEIKIKIEDAYKKGNLDFKN